MTGKRTRHAGPDRQADDPQGRHGSSRRRARRVVRAPGFVPAEANLRPPRLRDGVVIRGELVDTLREHADVPVVLVVGPPGYGKTTLLAQWDAEDNRPFAFLTVDAAADDPAVLVTYLMLALQRLGGTDLDDVDGGVLTALADRSAVSTVLLPRLGRLLVRQRGPVVLVVDGAEALSSPEAGEVLVTVARHLGPRSQLVVAGRTAPRLPVGRLLAERALLTIGPDDLRLTAAEVRAVLTTAGVGLPPDGVAALLDRTEGWAAAVYLAALALRSAGGRPDVAAALSADDGVVADYLRDDVLARLPRDERRFLVGTSVLDRLTGPLCDAVLGTSGSGELLRRLHRTHLFVVPADPVGGHGEWYRCHPLFRAVLRRELDREDEPVSACLHARASRWLEAAGELDEAVRHAQAAGEVERTARLVWTLAPAYLASGRIGTLRGWLDAFSSEQVATHAKLALTAAWCALESGRPVEHWIAAAEHAVFDASRPGESRSVAANLALLHAARAQDGVPRMRADAERATALQLPEDPWRAYAQYLAAVAVLLGGEVEDARAALEQTAALADAVHLPGHRALCLAQLAVLALERGAWDETAALADAASALLDEHGLAETASAGLVHCVASLVLAKQGRADEARRLARRAMRLIALLNQYPPWLAVEARYLLGRAHLLTGDTAAARILLSEAQNKLAATADADWLGDRLAEAWKHVEQFPLATGMGPSALTSAELKVLQLLPTHLSLEAIAKHLSVSRNTVKTQAIAAYRKLGVSSRAAAVERAISLGMIETS